jgi:hypothetical protein
MAAPSYLDDINDIPIADNDEPVWIMFITDTEARDRMIKFGNGSQWEVDPSTAAAMILVGAAVKMPSAMDAQFVPGVGGMSMPASPSA